MKKPEIFFIITWILSLLWRFYHGPYADLAVLFSGLCLFVAYLVFSKGLFGLSLKYPSDRYYEIFSGAIFSIVILFSIFSISLWSDLFPYSIAGLGVFILGWLPYHAYRFNKNPSNENLFLGIRGGGLVIIAFFVIFKFLTPYFYSDSTEPRVEKSMGLSEIEINRLNQVVDSFRQAEGIIGIAIGVHAKGDSFIAGFGHETRGGNVPSSNSVFGIGSVTKPIVGSLFSLLEQEGRVYLEGEFEFGNAHLSERVSQITNRQLLSHTSGLPRMLPEYFSALIKAPKNPYKFISDEAIKDYLSEAKFSGNPLMKLEYSNLGYALLAQSLTQLGGIPYNNGLGLERLFKDYVFQPLEMVNTSVFPNGLSLTGRYNPSGKEMPMWSTQNHHGAFAVNSTVNDLLIYLEAHMSYEEDLFHKGIKHTLIPLLDFEDNESVGYGWQINKKGEDLTYWHSGATFYSSSFVYFNPKADVSIVILSNTGVPVDGLAQILLREFLMK